MSFVSLFSIWTHKKIWNVYWINVRDLNVRYITEMYIRKNVVSGFYSYIVTSFESINNGTSRKTELKNFYFIYQPPDLIEQRGKTALININQIQVSICVIIPNKLCVSASEAHLPICPWTSLMISTC